MNACDSDRHIGLTWKEMETCVERYSDVLEFVILLPTKEEFNKMAGEDKCLTFEEWEHTINGTKTTTTADEGKKTKNLTRS